MRSKTVKYRKADGTEVVYRYPRAAKKTDHAPHDLADLITEYLGSSNFSRLAASSRKDYRTSLEFLRTEVGHVPIAEVRRRHVLGLRDAVAATPAKANKITGTLAVLFNFAVDREYRTDNPAARIPRLSVGEYKRWSDRAIDYALAHFPERFRRAVVLALHTGQRPGDVVAMRWDDWDGDGIYVRQQKTGVSLWIPAHRELKRELADWKRDRNALTILETTRGGPWSRMAFAVAFSREVRSHAALQGLVFHGLRKTAAARLAEVGCTVHEIAAITGHKSLAMIAHYTAEADQKTRASAAIAKLEKRTRQKS